MDSLNIFLVVNNCHSFQVIKTYPFRIGTYLFQLHFQRQQTSKMKSRENYQSHGVKQPKKFNSKLLKKSVYINGETYSMILYLLNNNYQSSESQGPMNQKPRRQSQRRESDMSYQKISFQRRKELIRLVVEEQKSVYRASRLMGINNSTAKAIIRKFRSKGSIFMRKSQKQHPEENQQVINEASLREQTPENVHSAQVQQTLTMPYQPELYYVYFPTPNLLMTQYPFCLMPYS